MSSPVDAARVGTNFATAADPWTVTLPASFTYDLLVVYGRTGGSTTFNLPTGWSWLVQNDASDATDDNSSIIYKWTVGNEGTSLSWDLSGSTKGGAIAWRITGARDPVFQVPEQAGANFTTTANTADPPSISPTGGSKDYLFLVMAGEDQETGAFTAAPATYASLVTANSGTTSTAGTNVLLGGASRQATTATENPGVFTHAAATAGGRAFTVAIHPLIPVKYPEGPIMAKGIV